MEMRSAIILLAFASVVLISGCVSSAKVDPNNGLHVNEFSAEPLIAEADDTVRLFLDVENVGGTTAQCITSELFGVEGWRDFNGLPLNYARPWRDKGIAFSVFGNTFNICYYDAAKGYICGGYTKGVGVTASAFFTNAFASFSNSYCGAYAVLDPSFRDIKFQPELTPPLPERNKAGQSFVAEWILRPPVLPEGLKVDYPVTARTSYFYTSNAHMNVKAFNKAELRRKEAIGEPTVFPLEIANTHAAPIQIYAVEGPSPIIVNPDPSIGGPVELENFRFEIVNTGEGFPLPITRADVTSGIGPEVESGFIFAVLTVRGPGAFFYDCLGQQGTDIIITGDVLANLVKLRSSNRAPLSCTIGVDKVQWVSTPAGTVSITFQMWYRYFIDREAVVRVVGVERL